MKISNILFLVFIVATQCFSKWQGSLAYEDHNRLHIGIHKNSHSIYLRPLVDKLWDTYQTNRIGAKLGYKYTHQVFEYKLLKISAIIFSGYGIANVDKINLTTNAESNYFENNFEIGIQPEFRFQNFAIILEPFQWEYYMYEDSRDRTILNFPGNEILYLEIGFKFYINISD